MRSINAKYYRDRYVYPYNLLPLVGVTEEREINNYLDMDDFQASVEYALFTIPAICREVIKFYLQSELTFNQISRIVDLSTKSCNDYFWRGIRMLNDEDCRPIIVKGIRSLYEEGEFSNVKMYPSSVDSLERSPFNIGNAIRKVAISDEEVRELGDANPLALKVIDKITDKFHVVLKDYVDRSSYYLDGITLVQPEDLVGCTQYEGIVSMVDRLSSLNMNLTCEWRKRFTDEEIVLIRKMINNARNWVESEPETAVKMSEPELMLWHPLYDALYEISEEYKRK